MAFINGKGNLLTYINGKENIFGLRVELGENNDTEKPVAYLYNGYRLPPLPDYDREAYPYAAIIYKDTDVILSGSHTASLWLFEKPLTAISSAQITKMGFYTEGKIERYFWISDERIADAGLGYENGLTDSWGYDGVYEDPDGRLSVSFTWSNHDILYTDKEGVRLSASEPIPVYE